MSATDDGLDGLASLGNNTPGGQGADQDEARRDDSALGSALRAAKAVSLTRRAITPEAEALDAAVCELIEAKENRKYKRWVDRRGALLRAVSAFLGSLLSAHPKEWIRHSADRSAFTGGPVSYRHFAAAWSGMEKAGLIERKAGHTHLKTAFEVTWVHARYETRFRATSALRALANSHGVDKARGHYRVEDTGRTGSIKPIALRQFSKWENGRGKVEGKPIEFNHEAPKALRLARDVIRLNEFWKDVQLGGGIHRGFTRIFHTPNDSSDDFRWDMGGRLYSAGAGSYQTMSEEERASMTINGEAVVELDAQASNLTLFQALVGEPLDVYSGDDPYQVGPLKDFPREAVKAYITAAFGQGRPLEKWGKDAGEIAVACSIGEVAKAIHDSYPALATLEDPCTWARLMFAESQAVIRALLQLADQGIPALPVHDSIIVPGSKVAQARDALRAGYYLEVGAEPRVTDSPTGSSYRSPSARIQGTFDSGSRVQARAFELTP
jgi:hypothetical protein